MAGGPAPSQLLGREPIGPMASWAQEAQPPGRGCPTAHQDTLAALPLPDTHTRALPGAAPREHADPAQSQLRLCRAAVCRSARRAGRGWHHAEGSQLHPAPGLGEGHSWGFLVRCLPGRGRRELESRARLGKGAEAVPNTPVQARATADSEERSVSPPCPQNPTCPLLICPALGSWSPMARELLPARRHRPAANGLPAQGLATQPGGRAGEGACCARPRSAGGGHAPGAAAPAGRVTPEQVNHPQPGS